MKRPSGHHLGLFALYAIATLLIGARAADRHAPGDPVRSSSFQLLDDKGQTRGRFIWREELKMAEFIMEDGRGRARYALRVDDAGKTEMMILSPRGGSVIDARVGADGEDPSINLDGTSGKGGLHLGLADEHDPSVNFLGENGANRMRLGFAEGNRVAIELADGKGRRRNVLAAEEGGASSLNFFNEDGQAVLEVRHSDEGDQASGVSFFRGNGKVAARLHLDRDDSAGLSLFDGKDRERDALFIDKDGNPGHVISGDDGKELFVAPPGNPPRRGK